MGNKLVMGVDVLWNEMVIGVVVKKNLHGLHVVL